MCIGGGTSASRRRLRERVLHRRHQPRVRRDTRLDGVVVVQLRGAAFHRATPFLIDAPPATWSRRRPALRGDQLSAGPSAETLLGFVKSTGYFSARASWRALRHLRSRELARRPPARRAVLPSHALVVDLDARAHERDRRAQPRDAARGGGDDAAEPNQAPSPTRARSRTFSVLVSMFPPQRHTATFFPGSGNFRQNSRDPGRAGALLPELLELDQASSAAESSFSETVTSLSTRGQAPRTTEGPPSAPRGRPSASDRASSRNHLPASIAAAVDGHAPAPR